MAEVVYVALLSAVLAALVVYAFCALRDKKSTQALISLQTEQAYTVGELQALQVQRDTLLLDKQRFEMANAVAQEKLALQTQLYEQLRLDFGQATVQVQVLQGENMQLKTRQEEKEQSFAQQLQQIEAQKEILKKEFENLANKILEDKGKVLSEHHKQSIENLLHPFRLQMQDFRQKVEDIHHKDTQQQVQLRTELQQLQALNKQMTEEAHHLATALKGQKKMQGNWGELVLENVLDRSGLQLGKDYAREVSFNTEQGRSRPDVVVYLPEQKHLVIDAKVSLNAYTRFVNAEDSVEREQALKEHVLAISERIRELSDRSYYQLPGLNSPEMVFMFIPIESAFVEALKADDGLFQRALERNVLVATPTTLLTSLNIVRQLWRFEDQNRHTAELAEKATKVYDKLNGFVLSMEALGKSLDKAKEAYEKAFGQLYSGRGNLIKQASEFKNLGVAVKTEIPQHIVEKSELELTHLTQDQNDERKTIGADAS